MKQKIIFLMVMFFALPLSVQANGLKDDPRVDSALKLLGLWLDAQCAYEQIPGISMAVVHDQDLLWSQGIGYSDLDKMNPRKPETIQSICSVSKLFTSIAVLQLRDAGKLRLDDPVAKHLPWFTLEQTYPDGPPVTIRGMLTQIGRAHV